LLTHKLISIFHNKISNLCKGTFWILPTLSWYNAHNISLNRDINIIRVIYSLKRIWTWFIINIFSVIPNCLKPLILALMSYFKALETFD
jgi:hypothetical protein